MSEPIRFENVSMTPDLATSLLERNGHNRNLRNDQVQSLIRDIRAGAWKETGETIKISPDGSLLDGQHRLWAVVLSGITVPMTIAHNVPEDSQTVLDTGARRTAGDALRLLGHMSVNETAAAARMGIIYERGRIWAAPSGYGPMKTTHTEIIDFVDRNPDILDAVVHARTTAPKADCSMSTAAFTIWAMSRIDGPAAYQFWTDAATRIGLTQGDPVLVMAERFADIRRRRESWPVPFYISAIFRTWNMRRAGKSIERLQMSGKNRTLQQVELVGLHSEDE